MDQSPIVICGCPRSGTQMMGRVFGNLSDDFCLVTEHTSKATVIPEDQSGVEDHRLWWTHFEYQQWDSDAGCPIVDIPVSHPDSILNLRAAYEQLAMGRRLVIKNPSHILYPSLVRDVFPEAHFVYCQRSPWPTLQSMTKKGRESFLLRSPRQTETGLSLLERAAIGWSDAVNSYLTSRDDRWCVSEYDSVVADPRNEIGQICEQLSIPRGSGFEAAVAIPALSPNDDFSFIKRGFAQSPSRERIADELRAGCEQFGYPLSPNGLSTRTIGQKIQRVIGRLTGRAA